MTKTLIIVMVLLTLSSCTSNESDSVSDTTEENKVITPLEPAINLKDTMKNTFQLFSFSIGDNFVSISPLPGKVNLQQDITTIKANGITNVITLVSQSELDNRNLQDFFTEMDKAGLEVYHSPIVDYGLPTEQQMDSIISYVQNCMDNNKNVLIHCMGGYGRSGTVMGCYAQKFLKVEDPIAFVRSVRGDEAIETPEQVSFVKNY